MKALILNSGIGSRMGEETKSHPKCMTSLYREETILSRQLKQLKKAGISDVIITTGYMEQALIEYCNSLDLKMNISFVYNSRFKTTNYIYSIYLAKEFLLDDIVILHGDLVFSDLLLEEIVNIKGNYMAVDRSAILPEKDFKAVIKEGMIKQIGIMFFENAVAAQPMYKFEKDSWKVWLSEIIRYCENDNVNCYAENAFNEISSKVTLYPYEIGNFVCREIDTVEDWNEVKKQITNRN